MTIQRMDDVLIVVDDLEAVNAGRVAAAPRPPPPIKRPAR